MGGLRAASWVALPRHLKTEERPRIRLAILSLWANGIWGRASLGSSTTGPEACDRKADKPATPPPPARIRP